MTSETLIRAIVSDDDNILNIIKNAPQTYNSLLQEFNVNGTLQQILRRRIKRLIKENKIYKLRVPGTRFGLVLFCAPDHEYKILVCQTLTGVNVFYMYVYDEDKYNIILKNYWQLNKPGWCHWNYNTSTLKIPKYALREGEFRIWE